METAAPQSSPDLPAEDEALVDLRVRPTQQGTVYLWTLGVFSLFLLYFQAHLAFLLGTCAIGCAGVAWLLTRRNLQEIRVERLAPARARAGTPVRLTWRAHNEGTGTRIGVEISDRPSRGAKPVRLILDMPVIDPKSSVDCEADVVFGRRGRVNFERVALEVSSRYPLGLFRAEAKARTSGTMLVRPREGRVTPLLRRRLAGRRVVEAQRRLGHGDDVIFGVREYREGDDPRRIHWRTTAKRGALAVSEWRAEQGNEIVIVLGRGVGAGGPSAAHFERAVSAAASIFRACLQDGLHVTLDLGDRSPLVLPPGARGLDKGLDALASVAAQGSRNPRAALKRLAQSQGSRTLVYVGAGRDAQVESEIGAAAGRGGVALLVPAWQRGLKRWVRGLA